MVFLQPTELTEAELEALEPFLPPEAEEQFKNQPVDQVVADEKQRLKILDRARREYEMEQQEAEISGALPADAEAFRDLQLKPKLTEVHSFEQTVRTPVVQGVLFRDTLAWIAGPSGTFKSFVTADLAFRYGAEDLDYHGRRMTSGRALLVIAEGAGGYADRRAAWEKEHDREVKNVVIYPAPLQLADTLKEMPALLSVLREEEAAGNGFGLVVFDTQAMCTVGVDENSSEMNLIMNVLHRIREVSGACVLVVHHYGKKESAGMRGSSMIYAAADTVIAIEREKGTMDVSLSTAGDNGKQKDAAAEDDIVTLTLNSHVVAEDYFGDPLTSLVPVLSGAAAHDLHDDPEGAPVSLPDVTDTQMPYLKALNFYEGKGTSPAGMALHMRDGGRVTSGPNARNKLVELGKKKLAVQPTSKGPWFITPMGVAVIARQLALGESWVERSAPRRARKGDETVGQETVSGIVLDLPAKRVGETIETELNESAKLSLTCDETGDPQNETTTETT